ncbi:tRNA lysidine(34) synthetase TilS [uncultured Desulfovibrio sp.]|uniref:tRNA lysidine(34) synthetase TilS n=1 Tax=uncultured Desulfovibrio sp. TaxID=167968 RepID=UPI0026289C79|nr:tRNA lysidine(34) synthetase TilS [uncultured Desulfovibrio sp.]
MQHSLPRRLSPAAVRLLGAVERFCREDLRLPRGAHLLLGVSGGADSAALALVMRLLAPRLDLALHALTVNHGLRPEAADDAAHARRLCAGLGIPCAVRDADVRGYAAARAVGLEDAGRRLRYALLEGERRACGADCIALGHHAGDVSEDVLLRLVRGAGWPALGGMTARDDARRLVRPLLAADPAALRALLRECGLAWREDGSNADRRFRRNRLRHDVLPLLREENPSLERTLLDLWRLARLDEDYWNARLDEALAACPWQEEAEGLVLPAGLLRGLPPAARLRLYLRAVRRMLRARGNDTPHTGQARARTLLALDQALRDGRGNTRFQLPGLLEARLAQGSVHLRFADREAPASGGHVPDPASVCAYPLDSAGKPR